MTGGGEAPGNLTPEQAIREVLRLERRVGELHQRVVGMTWMVWALINGGLFVSYEALAYAQPTGLTSDLGNGLVWVPWIGLGIGLTATLWRSLELVKEPVAGVALGKTAAAVTTFMGLILGGLAVLSLTHVAASGLAWALFAVGVASAAVGGSGLTTRERPERLFWLLGGGTVAGLATGLALAAPALGYDPTLLLVVLAPSASTALLFLGGLFTVSR